MFYTIYIYGIRNLIANKYLFVDHTLTNLVYKNTLINVSNKLVNVYTRVTEIAVFGETNDTVQI